MLQAAKKLNLKQHKDPNDTVLLAGPCDIEGHRGWDNEFYLLGTTCSLSLPCPRFSVLICFFKILQGQCHQSIQEKQAVVSSMNSLDLNSLKPTGTPTLCGPVFYNVHLVFL